MPRCSPRSPIRWKSAGAVAVGLLVIAAACGDTGRRAAPHATPPPSTTTVDTAPAPTSTRPTAPSSTVATTTVPPAALPAPPRLAPLARPAIPGEGIWQPAPGSAAPGGYTIYTTDLRPGTGFPLAGIAWINTRATRLALYAGSAEPYGQWPWQGYVGVTGQRGLLAAFNSGFKIYTYSTGWYEQGFTAMPLQPGAASLVISTSGVATVGAWGRDVSLSPSVEAVRQNLTLLVDHAVPAANAAEVGAWGATLGGVARTWRSGVGVTGAGDLVYVAGPLLDPDLLARLLIAAGAVRAMELDINPEWVSFATYRHIGAGTSAGANLLPGMYFSPDHYLQPDSRDFFAVFSR